MPPLMPVTMRGDGRGIKAQRQAPVARYFPGKGIEEAQDSASESEPEVDNDQGSPEDDVEGQEEIDVQSKPKIQLAKVDLERHYEQERILERQRLEIEAEIAARESESEYETDNSDGSESEEEEEEEAPRRVLLKPTFISKSQRQNLKSSTPEVSSRLSSQPEDALDEQQKRRLEARKLIEEQTRLEALNKLLSATDDQGHQEVDDTDNLDPPAELASWKLRELLRIRRDRDAIEVREQERDEIEKRKAMPEADRLADDMSRIYQQQREKQARIIELRESGSAGGGGTGGGKGRHHHQGGYFQDDPIHARKLTGVIENTQAGAGLRGATRWSGLKDQDTSRDQIWNGGGAGSGGREKRGIELDYEGRKKKRT